MRVGGRRWKGVKWEGVKSVNLECFFDFLCLR